MAEFHAEVFQNEFLPAGGTDVHAIVSVSCSGAGEAGRAGMGDAAEIIIVDCSTSMARTKIAAARQAAAVAVDQILDGAWFAVVAGTDAAYLAYPDPATRLPARHDGPRAGATPTPPRLQANGGTAIGRWLRLTRDLFDYIPQATQRHAILLTDGQDQGETPRELQESIAYARGAFQCDCRGVGADWQVSELRAIATELMGGVELIAEPSGLEADFEALMRAAMGRGVAEATLRVWAPQGSEVLYVRQVAPTLEDLSSRRVAFNPLTGDYPTGAWGDESRDYHVAVRVGAKPVGAEQLVGRVQLVVGGDVVSSGMIKATWSDNELQTTRIDPAVAHYTGQVELAEAIQDGLAARSAGDDATATVKLGRAVQLATETGNDEATTRLRKLVDITDAGTGTVRLKRDVDKLAEMEVDTFSTKTVPVKK